MSRIFISAAHKSSGKTTLSIGLCAALTRQNNTIQAFKKGPDYIDPLWLSQASKRPCYNLDFFTMNHDEILNTYQQYATNCDISVIEGNKGLFDGLDLDGSNSNAALAKSLQAPVVLVIDARGMTRGVAPLILGYQNFDQEINIAGVILNQLGGQRHEDKLRQVIEHYTDVPVVGAVYRNPDIEIDERHLGLIPSNEQSTSEQLIEKLADIVTDQVDLNTLKNIAGTQSPTITFPPIGTNKAKQITIKPDLKIGVARDAAFGFYYQNDFDALQEAGAELVFFDTLKDTDLPKVDALFIGGGFPETHLKALEANKTLRKAIHDAIEQGMPVYAECGGLMYLSRSIKWHDKKYSMVGSIQADACMNKKPQGRGYVKLVETSESLWPIAPKSTLHAHEFHYSALENMADNLHFAYEVKRGVGVNGSHDGIIYKALTASYSHMRNTEQSPWAQAFVNYVRNSIN